MAKRDNSTGAQLGESFRRLEKAQATWGFPRFKHESEIEPEFSRPGGLESQGMKWEQMNHLRKDLRTVREGFGKIPWRTKG